VIAVLIPTRNGAAQLPPLLAALARQSVLQDRIAIDTSSHDGTRELLVQHRFRVTGIEPQEFGHGRTRQRLVEQASAEFVVFFSQDAQPQGDDFLERLIAPLRGDPGLAGVCARVLPRLDDDPLTARSVLAAAESSELALEGVAAAAAFHNVAAAYRRSVLARAPFPDLAFGEDQAWARARVGAGESVRLEPSAVVRHSHRYGLREAFQRFRIDAEFHRTQRSVRVRPNLLSALRGLGYELAADWRFPQRSLSGLARAPLLRAAQVWGQYQGSRGKLGGG
jgi:rhamnosyltransferase